MRAASVLAHLTGRRIVEHGQGRPDAVRDPDPRRPSRTPSASTRAIGGSTNAVVHLLAHRRPRRRRSDARRLGPARPRRADPRQPDAVGPVPDGGLLLCRRPAGRDEASSASRPAAPRRADRHRQDASARTSPTPPSWNREVIRPLRRAARRRRAASRCCAATSRPNGAVLKPSAATPHLLQHRGRAVVFETIEDYHARIDDRRSTSTRPASWC